MAKKKEEAKVLSIYDGYELDLDKEVDGIEKELDHLPGNFVTIARFGNPKCSKMLSTLMEPHQNSIRAGRSVPDGVMEDFLSRTIAATVWNGWRGPAFIAKEEGTDKMVPLKYSPKNALALLRNKSLKLLRDEIIVKAKAEEAFKRFQDVDAVDNLGE